MLLFRHNSCPRHYGLSKSGRRTWIRGLANAVDNRVIGGIFAPVGFSSEMRLLGTMQLVTLLVLGS
jgi:hypothetical protein